MKAVTENLKNNIKQVDKNINAQVEGVCKQNYKIFYL